VAFSSTAAIIGPSTYLLPGTATNIQSLEDAVNAIIPGGSTNYELAFKLAFDLFESSTLAEFSSTCQRSILFLTDGDITEGLAGQDIINYVNQLNVHNATLFMYSIGANVSPSGSTLLQGIACSTNGLYRHIPDGGDLVTAMSNYYQYYATLRQTTTDLVYWTEPYLDAGGYGGYVTSPSTSVYDTTVSPPILIGVAALDIKLSYFQTIEPNYDQILKALSFRSATCPTFDLDPCALENLRYREINSTTDGTTISLCGIPGCKFSETTAPVCIGPSQVIPFCDTPRTSFLDEVCCDDARRMYSRDWIMLLVWLFTFMLFVI